MYNYKYKLFGHCTPCLHLFIFNVSFIFSISLDCVKCNLHPLYVIDFVYHLI